MKLMHTSRYNRLFRTLYKLFPGSPEQQYKGIYVWRIIPLLQPLPVQPGRHVQFPVSMSHPGQAWPWQLQSLSHSLPYLPSAQPNKQIYINQFPLFLGFQVGEFLKRYSISQTSQASSVVQFYVTRATNIKVSVSEIHPRHFLDTPILSQQKKVNYLLGRESRRPIMMVCK